MGRPDAIIPFGQQDQIAYEKFVLAVRIFELPEELEKARTTGRLRELEEDFLKNVRWISRAFEIDPIATENIDGIWKDFQRIDIAVKSHPKLAELMLDDPEIASSFQKSIAMRFWMHINPEA